MLVGEAKVKYICSSLFRDLSVFLKHLTQITLPTNLALLDLNCNKTFGR